MSRIIGFRYIDEISTGHRDGLGVIVKVTGTPPDDDGGFKVEPYPDTTGEVWDVITAWDVQAGYWEPVYAHDVAQKESQPRPTAALSVSLDKAIDAYQQNVGDVNSDARGSGARFNSGKAPLELIPAHVLAMWEEVTACGEDVRADNSFLACLASWQQGEAEAFELLRYFDVVDLAEAAHVFDYGRKKYAAWNWAKGMPWSVPVGCILRHHLAQAATDLESGRLHWGHVLCNVIMLVHFERYYPEGDDRPPAVIWGDDNGE